MFFELLLSVFPSFKVVVQVCPMEPGGQEPEIPPSSFPLRLVMTCRGNKCNDLGLNSRVNHSCHKLAIVAFTIAWHRHHYHDCGNL